MKTAVGDTVGVAAGDAAEVRVVVIQIAGEIGEPERHVRELTIPVRGPDGADDAAVGDDLDAQAVPVRQGETVDQPPLDLAERLPADLDHRERLLIVHR